MDRPELLVRALPVFTEESDQNQTVYLKTTHVQYTVDRLYPAMAGDGFHEPLSLDDVVENHAGALRQACMSLN